MKTLTKALVLLLALAAGDAHAAAIAAPPSAPVEIAVHRALYSFGLLSADPSAGLSGVGGKMYFEQDDACEAWTTDRRFTTEYRYAEQDTDENDSHYTAFEAKDGRQFSFSSERADKGMEPELLRGAVVFADDGAARAVYSRPGDLSYNLPKGFFLPTMHTEEVIRRARTGGNFFSAVVFDGTDEDGPVDVSTVIGKKATAGEIKKIAARKNVERRLLTRDAWHVRMAFFPLKDKAEMAPAYEIDMIMHDNGVISDAVVDYKLFKVEQRLVALEKLPRKKCH